MVEVPVPDDSLEYWHHGHSDYSLQEGPLPFFASRLPRLSHNQLVQ